MGGRNCVPSLLFDLRPNYGGDSENNGNLLQNKTKQNFQRLSYTMYPDGRVEELALIFSKNSKITTCCWTTLTGECWIPPKKDTPHLRAKEKPQHDGRRGKITFRINPITSKDGWGAQRNLVCTGTQRPHRLSQNCIWVYPAEVLVSSGLL